MFSYMPTWTSERVELLKKLFDDGLSCREIAVSIGVSRNAVIGKLTRLGLTRGPTQTEQRLQKTTKARASKSDPRLQFRMLQALYEGEPPIDAPIATERRCSLLELNNERCRWPISTPGAKDFCFCGNEPLDGLPYCSGHTRLAYRSGARARA